MRRLNRSQALELFFWLALAGFLYLYSMDFARELETYKFGASAWPRAIIALLVIAALGQAFHAVRGTAGSAPSRQASPVDDAPDRSTAWYATIVFLVAIPFLYMITPASLAKAFDMARADVNALKLVLAAVLVIAYLLVARLNHFGAMLSLPILFAAFLQDFGFYALAPVFIVGVMYLMGERRPLHMAAVAAFTLGVLLVLFVSILYIGLPTGNISPFYEIGTTVVTWLQ
jgi:hypothetical protein